MLNCFSAEVGVETIVDFSVSVKGLGEARGIESREADMTAGVGVACGELACSELVEGVESGVGISALFRASDINRSMNCLTGAREKAVWSAAMLML